MTFLIFWILLSILVGFFASSKKRSGGGWFFISIFISPLIAFIILLVIGPSPSTVEK
jgi:biotin transporter BioY